MKLTYTATAIGIAAITSIVLAAPARAGYITHCYKDAALVGQTCVDKYEASVWEVPPLNVTSSFKSKVRTGTVTKADLDAAGAVQLGCVNHPWYPGHQPYPSTFPADGQWTPVLPGTLPPRSNIFALSIPGVLPTACTTWFQAEQACRNSGKRLLTNQEWQAAIAGEPNTGADNGTTDCNLYTSLHPSLTGSRANCVSNYGVYDLNGNLMEWVADWMPNGPFSCSAWMGYSFSCLGGAGANSRPGAVYRGGNFWGGATDQGNFSIATAQPDTMGPYSGVFSGFRCGR